MKKNPTYILELKLNTEVYHEDILNKRFEIARKMYNAILGEALKRYNHLKRTRKYKLLLKELIKINNNIKINKDKKINKKLEKERREINKILNEQRKDYGLTEYELHKFIAPMKRHFNSLDINTAQKIATRAWSALEKVIFGDGRKVSFKKYGELNSIEGKSNGSGIKFRDNHLIWNKLNISVKIRENDIYAKEALKDKIKYCRIVRKVIRGKYKFYIQLVLEGYPPVKRNKQGENKQKYSDRRVGIDPSLRSIAYSSDTEVGLRELAPSVDYIDKEINYIDTWKFKASQYCHDIDVYKKVSLSTRWKIINGNKVQRDLYSAFLIMNSKDNLKEIDRDKCNEKFDRFLKLHNEEIEIIENDENIKIFSSFGIKK